MGITGHHVEGKLYRGLESLSLRHSTPTDVGELMATRVLVVDDEDSVRRLGRQILEIEGLQVGSATDGEKGLQKVHDFHPDVMVLDLMMPVLDGWGVLER